MICDKYAIGDFIKFQCFGNTWYGKITNKEYSTFLFRVWGDFGHGFQALTVPEENIIKRVNKFRVNDHVRFTKKNEDVCTMMYDGIISGCFMGYANPEEIKYRINYECDKSCIVEEKYVYDRRTSNDFSYDLTYGMKFKPGVVDRNGTTYSEEVFKTEMFKRYLNSHYGISAISHYHKIPEIVIDEKFKFDREKMNKLAREYSIHDCLITKELIENMMKITFTKNMPAIKKVHFSGGVTVVIFEDGSKVIVKCQDGETFDPEKGLAMAIAKRALGTNKSGSNYYDEFKKWLPKEEKKVGPIDTTLNTGHSIILDPDNPCVGCTDRKTGCLANCQKMQEYADSVREQSKPELIQPGYFLQREKERQEQKDKVKPVVGNPVPVKKEDPVPLPITTFVNKFEASLFPQEFINFCKKNNLCFYIVDEIKGGLKMIDPYKVTWQQVTGYLKRGLMESCKKVKYHKNAATSFLAVHMDKAVFSRIKKEEN